ncbi:hypothetical protein QF047_001905 [Arthrobacter sp. W4I7]|nr:hypothetical protein [Arthrobacter sp. W4I7]
MWIKENWRRYFRSHSILEALPSPIDRTGVLERFTMVNDPDSALDAYIASYVWAMPRPTLGHTVRSASSA